MNKAQLRGSGRAKSLGRLGLNKSCQADHVHRCQVEEDKEAQRRNEHLAIFGGGGGSCRTCRSDERVAGMAGESPVTSTSTLRLGSNGYEGLQENAPLLEAACWTINGLGLGLKAYTAYGV